MSMMNNLFSMFDPSTSYMSLAWAMLFTPPMLLLNKSANMKSKKSTTISTTLTLVSTEINQLTKPSSKKAMEATMLCLFYSILLMNLTAILPFNFTPTAQISTTLLYSLTLWTVVMINAIGSFTKKTIAHLTPLGTPTALMNFMVLIEVISQMIRPITLAVRLMANMVAGHLLINLLSNFSLISPKTLTLSAVPMTMLIMLEVTVAFIQAYVITILVTLYYKETF